jgi:hypothetical protein
MTLGMASVRVGLDSHRHHSGAKGRPSPGRGPSFSPGAGATPSKRTNVSRLPTDSRSTRSAGAGAASQKRRHPRVILMPFGRAKRRFSLDSKTKRGSTLSPTARSPAVANNRFRSHRAARGSRIRVERDRGRRVGRGTARWDRISPPACGRGGRCSSSDPSSTAGTTRPPGHPWGRPMTPPLMRGGNSPHRLSRRRQPRPHGRGPNGCLGLRGPLPGLRPTKGHVEHPPENAA